MSWFTTVLKGVGIGAAGAAVMYLSDPISGRRRRTRLQNRARTIAREVQEFRHEHAGELGGRWSGAFSRIRQLFTRSESDRFITDKVRSVMSRYVAHPSQIDVSVEEGTIILTGPIFSDEIQPFIRAVESIRGVSHVENHLEVQEANVSSMSRARRRWRRWMPSPRGWAIGGGLGLLGAALAGSRLAGAGLSGLGMGLLMRKRASTANGRWFRRGEAQTATSRKSRRTAATV